MVQLLKIGGNQIDQPDFLAAMARVVAQMAEKPIVVHGGGKEITQLQAKFELQARYVDGLRVTDPASLELVKMVLCGAVNPRIVETLQLAGVTAQGLSGLDQGLLRARKLHHPAGDLERVGEVTAVNIGLLHDLLQRGIVPVIAPICLGEDGAYNVNADQVAGAIGAAIGAERVIFLTNVPGVLKGEELLERLTVEETESLIAQGVITGGMQPKVCTALQVVAMGVQEAVIANLPGLAAGVGTAFIHTTEEEPL